jgi:phospholipid/cholesterol/gamma-HCH transport system permease protein
MTASSAVSVVPSGVRIELQGRLTAYSAAPVWRSALDALAGNPRAHVVIDASHLEYADDVGIALLFDLIRRDRPAGAKVEIRNLSPNLTELIQAYHPKDFTAPCVTRPAPGILEQVGRATEQHFRYSKRMRRFIVACTAGLASILAGRKRLNWLEVVDVANEAGANGVPIVALVGFLMGLIIAAESALELQKFGAVIYVVGGVGFGLLREISPLMTAIVFAGRTGAAFAAQLGTQKINEEVNAITTFGINPITFLVLPRIIAAALVMPLLAALAGILGLFGAAIVMLRYDISFLQFYNEMVYELTAWDFMLGLIKGAVFGITIAVVACERGLTTGGGATSVGQSTTSAVVTSIVLMIFIDGIFAIFTS